MLKAPLEGLIQFETTLLYVGPLEELIEDLGNNQVFMSRHDVAVQLIPSLKELADALRKLPSIVSMRLNPGMRPRRVVVYGLERYINHAQLNMRQQIKLWGILLSLVANTGDSVILADKVASQSQLASALNDRAGKSFSNIYSQEYRV